MSRATKILAGTTIVGALASIWLYLDNQSLREDLAEKTEVTAKAETRPAGMTDAEAAEWEAKKARDGKIALPGPQPELPEAKGEHRLERRMRRQEEFAAMFGREEGETEEQWRARVAPMIAAGLMRARLRTNENRKIAEEKAKVTPEQSAKMDAAMYKVYDDVLDYANRAVKDGQLSPYERNVAGMLEFAGGLGGILNDAQGQMSKILTPEQMKAMYESGFDWGEYMGAQIRWEDIAPPPPRKN